MSRGKSTSRDVPSDTSQTGNQETEDESKNEEPSPEFEFHLSYKQRDHDAVSCYYMLSPKELFCNGEIVPLLSRPKLLAFQHRLSETDKSMKTSFVNGHKIMLPKMSHEPSQFCDINDIETSPSSILREWKNISRLKMDDDAAASPDDETVRRYSQWPARSRLSLAHSKTVLAKFCTRSISVRAGLSAKTAKSLRASAQSVIRASKREPWAPWCCSTPVVPAKLSVSPTGATANPISRLKLNVVDINARLPCDVQTVTYISPLRVNLPDAEKPPNQTMFCKEFSDLKGNDWFPLTYPAKKSIKGHAEINGRRQTYISARSPQNIIRIRNEEHTEKVGVTNADRSNNSFGERKSSLTAELNRNGRQRSQGTSLRYYEKNKIYQRNAQATQVLHMNGCLGKSLSSHKIRFSERSFSDYPNKTTLKYNIDR